MRKGLTAVFGALALLACGRGGEKTDAPAPAPAPAATAPAEISAIDEFGPFEGPVRGAAFWVHPAIAFNSLAIVAGEMGLVALNIEDGEEVAAARGWPAAGVSVFYGEAAEARGADAGAQSDVLGVAVAADAAAGKFRFFEIDNSLRALNERASDGAPKPGAASCAGGGAQGPARLANLVASRVEIHALALVEATVTVRPGASVDLPRPGVACVIDRNTGDVYALLSDGRVARVEGSGGGAEILFVSGAASPAGIGLAVNGVSADAADATASAACCGRLFVLDAADAALRVFDLETRQALGLVRLVSSFDVEGVSAATAAGIGSGNFGGVYRDGVVALATGGARPVLRLAPLAGVLEALGPGSGPALNPREAGAVSNQASDQECAADGFDPVDPAACTRLAPPAIPELAPPAPQ